MASDCYWCLLNSLRSVWVSGFQVKSIQFKMSLVFAVERGRVGARLGMWFGIRTFGSNPLGLNREKRDEVPQCGYLNRETQCIQSQLLELQTLWSNRKFMEQRREANKLADLWQWDSSVAVPRNKCWVPGHWNLFTALLPPTSLGTLNCIQIEFDTSCFFFFSNAIAS